MKVALLVSTYNWPDALDLVFKSFKAQTVMPDEILIADDGSREETTALINNFISSIAVPVKHVWHEDDGFRRSKILNKTIAASSADYIVQIDGDCIIHPDFVKDHKAAIEKGVYLYGSRVNILPDFVKKIFSEGVYRFTFFSKEIKNKARTFRIPLLSKFYKPHQKFSSKVRGCNLSYWRSDFIEINGYNEDFEGWGREDSDLVIRLGNKGVMGKRLKYAGILYHIYHKSSSKDNLELNNALQNKTIAEKMVRCKNGIDKYL